MNVTLQLNDKVWIGLKSCGWPVPQSWPKPPSLTLTSPPCYTYNPRKKIRCYVVYFSPWMANPELDHGFVYDHQGSVDILQSPFFDPNWEIEDTFDEYVDRILFTLTSTLEEHQPSGHWRIIGLPPTSSPPANSLLIKTVVVLLLSVASLELLKFCQVGWLVRSMLDWMDGLATPSNRINTSPPKTHLVLKVFGALYLQELTWSIGELWSLCFGDFCLKMIN
ncbi:hypothetical protein IEQ34_013642 [Dendrobium chrysotoxum]|uniref:Uncharacterized protein n=1 Tax=Dendrobium chrysotoxum TaxID=161865 RepID=A0AAV7GRX2_DENCH|nr:hypothetical protein IEQ34_013642 [Dendrobium chrysotoxum]